MNKGILIAGVCISVLLTGWLLRTPSSFKVGSQTVNVPADCSNTTNDKIIYDEATNSLLCALDQTTAGGTPLLVSNDLSDLNSASAARANLGGVLTTSTGLGVANFTSPNVSQWTNNAGYIATSTGLTKNNFSSPNISQWTNDSGYVTSSAGASPYYTPQNITLAGVSTWTNMPLASTEFLGGAMYRSKFNFASTSQISVNAIITTIGATATTSLALQYSTETVTWFALAETSSPQIVIGNTTGSKLGALYSVTSSVKNLGEVWVRVIGLGGNGTADPVFNLVSMYLR